MRATRHGAPARHHGPIRRLRGALGTAYRFTVTRGALLVIALWAAAAVLLPMILGGTESAAGGGLGTLLPNHSRAVRLEKQALSQFSVPVLSETSVVLRDPQGLGVLTRADDLVWAFMHDQRVLAGKIPAGEDQIIGAVPMPTESSTTAVTYLYLSNGTSPVAARQLAEKYASHFNSDPTARTYVTGLAPAEVSQQNYILSRLNIFAIASLALVAVIVAFIFRSVVAPVVVLGVFGVGYLVSQPLLHELANLLGFPMPQQIEPIVLALLLGVITDYSVLFFSDMRRRATEGLNHGDLVRDTLRQEAHVVLIAGLTVAGGTAALLVANFQLFRAFGPALSLTVLIGLALSLTLTPALMTLFGRRLFRLSGKAPSRASVPEARTRRAGPLIKALTRKIPAVLGGALVAAALLAAAYPLLHMRLSVSFTADLPNSDPVHQGAQVLAAAGLHGITGPTEMLIEQPGIKSQRPALVRLQREVERQRGVAEVLGPAQNPLPDRYGVLISKTGNAARLIVVFNADPLASHAIADLRRLRAHAPELARQAGLPNARVEFTGQTAIASELAGLTRSNLRWTLLAVLGVELLILLIYLRALITPFVLLACSALGVVAALGLTTWVFQGLRGDAGLTFYVPFATAVLLLSLGADYNVFTVGTIWNAAQRRPLRGALREAVPRSRRAIRSAGFILAATLAMVAIVPLETFWEVAFTMFVGLLIDTLLVRPVLTPAVLTLLGRVAGWPGNRVRTDRGADEVPVPEPAPVGPREGFEP